VDACEGVDAVLQGRPIEGKDRLDLLDEEGFALVEALVAGGVGAPGSWGVRPIRGARCRPVVDQGGRTLSNPPAREPAHERLVP